MCSDFNINGPQTEECKDGAISFDLFSSFHDIKWAKHGSGDVLPLWNLHLQVGMKLTCMFMPNIQNPFCRSAFTVAVRPEC